MIKVLFVCLGNICRSPMAQFVFKHMVDESGLKDRFEIDSAGTEAYNEIHHEGIHYGTRQILDRMHIPFDEHYARRIRKSDYDKYDYILVMDKNNVWDVEDIVGKDSKGKIHLLLEYSSNPRNIKDPWYTGNFDETYQDVTQGCKGFLKWLVSTGKIE